MVHNRYPADLPVTLEDFKSSGYESVIDSLEDYRAMWTALYRAAEDAKKNGQLKHGKILWLLADACSMILEPDNRNNPFKPLILFEGKRSVILEDFTNDDILFFSKIVMFINHNMLKARISDILWLRNRSLGIEFALTAIDSYMNININTTTMVTGGNDCLRRAINLSKTLKSGAGNRLDQIKEKIFNILLATKIDDGEFGIWLADLLIDSDIEKSKLFKVAEKLEKLTKDFEFANDNSFAQEYASETAKIYNILNNSKKSVEMLVCQAECLMKYAANNPSKLAAINFYEKAIEIYRSVPRKERAKYKIDDRIAELWALRTDAGKDASLEMNIVQSPGICISEIINDAEQLVKGKTIQEALLAFANLYYFANYQAIKDKAIKQIQEYPIPALFPSMIINNDGRIVAKTLGILSGEENAEAIFSQMVRIYLDHLGVIVHGRILPAKRILHLEHYFYKNDIYSIVKNSSIVPIGRELIITKALYAGFENDFITYTHLGIPQIENMIRFNLKKVGARTSTLNQDGTESENSLNTLIDLPEATEILGENLAFEIKALYCSQFGPNLRNETAHGLIEEDKCCSEYSIYSWWLMFKIIFNSFWSLKNNTTGHEKLSPPEEN
ncbi:MAG: DUF4209 domain-containing protein [Desulfovibrionaceae bacterium]|nr:DUF4209 domain-containing protein [Desulfovibrionaceae bacterium]